MSNRVLYIYNFPQLFEILNEIKKNLNIEVINVDNKNYNKIYHENDENYIFISKKFTNNIKENLLVLETPKKISELIEQINLSFLKIKFNKQSHLKIKKYKLDLNSRSLHLGDSVLDLTEKESNILIFINAHKKVTLRELQKSVWGHVSNLETHTVETHIHRLRKKIIECFNDSDFIKHDKDGYFISS